MTLDFSRDWEETAASVVRSLVWRGFDRALAEDAIQEAGARFLEGRAAGSNVTTPTEFRRWLYVVAKNHAIDHQRRAASAAAKLPMATHEPGADDVVEQRLKWEIVVGRLAEMDAPYQALAGELLGERRPGPRLNIERKRLERLRKRLSEAIATAVGSFLVFRPNGNRGQRIAFTAVAAASVAAALVIPAETLTHPQPSAAPPAQVAPIRLAATTAAGTRLAPVAAVLARPAVGAESRPVRRPAADATGPVGRQPLDNEVKIAPASTPPQYVGTRPMQDGDSIVCAKRWPVVGTRCVGQPTYLPVPVRR